MNKIPDETFAAICRVLELEDASQVDWDAVRYLCDDEIRRINDAGLGGTVNGMPYQFLEDYDVRRKDGRYGESQRKSMKNLLKLDNP